MKFRHDTHIQIRFNDVDMLGHVNNAVYQHYYDLARMQYFNDVIDKKMNWHEFGVIMAQIKIVFLKPVNLNDRIAIRTSVNTIGDKSLGMIQELYDRDTQEVHSQNEAVMVGFSGKKGLPVSIPEIWRKNISSFEEKVELKHENSLS